VVRITSRPWFDSRPRNTLRKSPQGDFLLLIALYRGIDILPLMSEKDTIRQTFEWESQISINSICFTFVKTQRDGISSIYKSENTYLRIGDTVKVKNDLKRHKNMEDAGFPVPKYLEEGVYKNMFYFIETSLGEDTLSTLFAKDYKAYTSISERNFDYFIKVMEEFVLAQLKTVHDQKNFESFANGIHIDTLKNELPEYAQKIDRRFELLKERLKDVPFVMTHGDLNPHNMYQRGVIDFEDSFRGPFGYDAVSAIFHIDNFPLSGECEFLAQYRFSEKQKQMYVSYIDMLCQNSGFEKLSTYTDEYIFARDVWSAVRMCRWPHIQEFRYNRLITNHLTF